MNRLNRLAKDSVEKMEILMEWMAEGRRLPAGFVPITKEICIRYISIKQAVRYQKNVR